MRVPVVIIALYLAGAQSPAAALVQAPTPEELASRITGTWRFNKELSPTLSNPGPGGGRRGRGASLAMSVSAGPQRGGRGGGGGANEPGFERPMVTTEEAAAQAALAAIYQVPQELTIEASATEMKLVEARGESLFKIDGKNATVDVPGARIKVKSKWDRGKLRQEFSSALQALVRSWSVDAQGRLILTQQNQSPTFMTKEVQAVFDKQ